MVDLFGSSALADIPELEANGLLGSTGIRLGAVPRPGLLGGGDLATMRYAGDHHHLIVAGSGGGKFVSSMGLILWDFLRQKTGSCVVIDPKGEALHKIGKMAMKPVSLWQPEKDFFVCWLDPWDLSKTGITWAFNFLKLLSADSPNLADDARALAEAIIIQGNRENPHWDESAKIFLSGLLVYVATHPAEADRRDLTRVCEILMQPWGDKDTGLNTLSGVLRAMSVMDDLSTLANGVGYQYIDLPDRERESIFSAARRDTVWIKSIPMQRVLKEGESRAIDLDHVAQHRYLLFLVLPFERIRTHRAWLRLLITAMADAFRRNPPRDNSFANRRHVFVDEWPRLQRLEVFQDEIAVARGAGVQYHFYCQSFGQIKDSYGTGWEDFVANSVVQAFAIQDKMTSEYLSSLTGAQTIESPSYSRQRSGWFRFSRSTSYNYAGRPVLMPDEIRRLGSKQLVVARGVNPALADMEYVYRAPSYARAEKFTLVDLVDSLHLPPGDGRLARFDWEKTA